MGSGKYPAEASALFLGGKWAVRYMNWDAVAACTRTLVAGVQRTSPLLDVVVRCFSTPRREGMLTGRDQTGSSLATGKTRRRTCAGC